MGYVEYDLADIEDIVTKVEAVPKRFKATFKIAMPMDYGLPAMQPIICVETSAGASAIRRWFTKAGIRNVHVYLDVYSKRDLWIVDFWTKTP